VEAGVALVIGWESFAADSTFPSLLHCAGDWLDWLRNVEGVCFVRYRQSDNRFLGLSRTRLTQRLQRRPSPGRALWPSTDRTELLILRPLDDE
jgi:hypothetical protein